jgi:hypothetical protein
MKAVVAPLAALLLFGCGDDVVLVQSGRCPSLLPRWSKPADGRSAFRPMSIVAIDGAKLTWNRVAIDDATLRKYVALSASMNPSGFVVLDATGADSCRTATKVRDEIDSYGKCRSDGLCGQGSAEAWEHAGGLSGPSWIE